MNNNDYLFEIINKNEFLNYVDNNKINFDKYNFESINKVPKDLLSFFLSFFEYNSSDLRYQYYINMLYKLFDDETKFLRPYIVVFNELELDELKILKYLNGRDINIEDTMDLDKTNNRFINQKIIKTEFDKIDLINKDNEKLYIDHLTSRNIVQWPVFKQDPVVENNTQVGIKRFSKITLTSFGKSFSEYMFE